MSLLASFNGIAMIFMSEDAKRAKEHVILLAIKLYLFLMSITHGSRALHLP